MVILVGDRKRVGKDTVSKYLKDSLETKYGKTVEVIALADPIKTICAKTSDVSVEELDHQKTQEGFLWDIRYFLIRMVSYLLRVHVAVPDRSMIYRSSDAVKDLYGRDCFMEVAGRKILKSKADVVIVSDFRLVSEWNFLHPLHVVDTIKVHRPTVLVNTANKYDAGLSNFNFDYVIDNTGTLDDLRVETDKVLDKLMNKKG